MKKIEENVIEKIQKYSLEDIMGSRFGRYAKYIIQDRAIPDVRDGLKPVQRRILYAMYKAHNTYDKSTVKSATTVGDVIGRYHPHGDTSVYGAMVRLSQAWVLRHPLIAFQGNNGSIDGDPAAAYRYTEAKLSKISNELLKDLDKDTVIFAPTFDDSRLEPTVLPSRFPNLLVNGTTGISAGYATNIPTHNLGEIIDATIKRIDSPNCRLDSILEIVKGPDFPTGGIIEGKDEIRKAYETGKGKIVVKCKYTIEKNKGKESIVITEIPYEVTLTSIVKKIEDIRIDKKIDGIVEARNETGKEGIRIVIDLKPDANKDLIINYLLKNTEMQVNYSINMVAVVNRRPKQLGILPMLDAYIEHQKEVVKRRTKFDLDAYMKEIHILEGLIKALSILDELIKVIRASKNKADAKINIINKFGFTEAQAEAIVMLQLYKLTNTDVVELQNRTEELNKLIDECNKILGDENELLSVIKKELRDIKKEFATPRLTEIKDEITEIKVDTMAMINKDDYIVCLTKAGYIKKMSIKAYNANTDEELPVKDGDYIIGLYKINNLNTIIAFTDEGNYLYIPVYEIEEMKFKDLGKHINTIVSLPDSENIISCYPVSSFNTDKVVTIITKEGMGKRALLKDFEVSRYTKPVTMMKLKDGDKVVSSYVSEAKEILCVTKNGYALRYGASEISTVGLKASGVKAIKLTEDEVVSAIPLEDNDFITLFTSNGNAKRVKVSEIEKLSRAKKGSSIIKSPKSKKYDVLKVFNNEVKTVFGLLYYDKLTEVKASDIPFFDTKSVGTNVSKKEITNVYPFMHLQKVGVEEKEIVREEVKEEIKKEEQPVYEELTMSDFFDEFKI